MPLNIMCIHVCTLASAPTHLCMSTCMYMCTNMHKHKIHLIMSSYYIPGSCRWKEVLKNVYVFQVKKKTKENLIWYCPYLWFIPLSLSFLSSGSPSDSSLRRTISLFLSEGRSVRTGSTVTSSKMLLVRLSICQMKGK